MKMKLNLTYLNTFSIFEVVATENLGFLFMNINFIGGKRYA